eukprot:1127467-Amphidinium_carterae.1
MAQKIDTHRKSWPVLGRWVGLLEGLCTSRGIPLTSSLRSGIRTSSFTIQSGMLSITHWVEEKHNTPQGGAKRHSQTVTLQEGGMQLDLHGNTSIGIPTTAHEHQLPLKYLQPLLYAVASTRTKVTVSSLSVD